MKTKNLKLSVLTAVAGATLLSSCNLLKDLNYTVTPNPLEMHGDSIVLTINGEFVEKGLHKKAIVEVTPVLIDADGTERVFRTEYFKGEKAEGNGIVIPKAGKKFSYKSTIACACDEFEAAELKVKLLPKKGTKTKEEVVTDKIADATILTPCMLMNDDKPLFGTDNFVRVNSFTTGATINYLKGKSNVRSTENKDQDILDFQTFVTTSMANPKVELKDITVMSYASPEGETEKNGNLAADRAGSAIVASKAIMKKLAFEAGTQDAFYKSMPKGEDWAGLKREVLKSGHEDAQIIVNVADMNGTPEKKEEELKNIAKTYSFLDKIIFPMLRRSDMVLNYDVHGLTDEELVQWSTAKPDSLKLEEILFTANTLVDDLNEKMRLYKIAEKNFPQDWRAANNVGYIHMLQNNITDAGSQFEKAAGLEQNAIVSNNLGAIARINGDRNKAEELFNNALSAGNEVKYNLGLVQIAKGEYGSAVENMSSYDTFNTGLAKYLNGDTDGAKSAIDGSADADSANGLYLKAVVAARTSDKAAMLSNLKSAIAKDGALKAKAAMDREFVKYFEDADFKTAVQ